MKRPGLPPGVMAVTRDRLGRTVILTYGTMRKIEQDHPDWKADDLTITTAIERAEVRTRGKKAGADVRDREVLWVENYGPAAWFRVVVRYDGLRGRVVTAYAGRKGPEDAAKL